MGANDAADQSVICSMESRLLNFSALSKTLRDGGRLNICHFASDLLLASAPKDHVYGVKSSRTQFRP